MLDRVVRSSILLFLVGCGVAPVEQNFGPLSVRVEGDPLRIIIDGPDHQPLLEGVPGGSVKPHDAPTVAAAFRTTKVDWAELYGSFNPDENYTDWHGVSSANSIAKKGTTISFSFDGGSGSVEGSDGAITITLKNPSQNRATTAFKCAAGEHFVGFGAQTADLDQHGQAFPLWVSEQGVDKVATDEPAADWFYRGTRHQTYFPMPFFISSRGYSVELQTSRRSYFDLCNEKSDAWRVEAWEGQIKLHIIYGPKPADIVQKRSDEYGRAPAPPAFTWAPWNDAIFGSAGVRQIAAALRQNHIPSSVIWTEDWCGGYFVGDQYNLHYNWNVDRTLYPDAEAVANDLHAQGFKWLGYFNTFVEMDGDHYQEGADKGYVIQKNGMPYLLDSPFFKPTTFVDLSNPAAAEWMKSYMDAALTVGFDGWMADYGEWQPVDAQLASGEDGEAAHNEYPILWQKLNERVLDGKPDAFDFVRSGYLGSQPIKHQVMWAGDQLTEFKDTDGLPTVPIIGITLGISGMPYIGSDIGGYTSPPMHDYTSKELFFRWTTVGALSPIMRTHHGTAPMLEWNWQKDAETTAHYARWAKLHQKLFPYLSAAADEAAATGMPMMRALLLQFPDDDSVWSIKDEYQLGPALLVAPVMTQGATGRDVYLPAGKWVPLFGGGIAQGMIHVDAATTEIPVFVPVGTSIDLLGDEVESLTGTIPPPAERWIYVDGDPGTISFNGNAVAEDADSATADTTGGGTLTVGAMQITITAGIRQVVIRW
jgi:alpha-glucosidase (family GH31 glycosyl hydrolase)